MLELTDAEALPQRGVDLDLDRRLEVRLIDRDGHVRLVSTDGRQSGGVRATLKARRIAPMPGIIRAIDVELSLVSYETRPGVGVQVILPLGEPATHFMIPGLIYGENRRAGCRLRYPRVAPGGAQSDSLTAASWAFRADRAPHPVVLGWTASSCLALATSETSPLGISGLSFDADDSYVALNFPGREEPVTYVGHDAAAPPEVMTHDWQAGEIASLRFLVFLLSPEPHAYDAVLRALYARDQEDHPLNPWMSIDEAAALASHGLYRWHYRPQTKTLAETVAFHRASDDAAPVTGDREAMHVAWLSGATAAYALLAHGRRHAISHYADAAASVLDTIASSLAPCGTFWGRWTPEGWDGGWNGHRDRIHARTIGEAALFMGRAIRLEGDRSVEHPAWEQALASNLRFACQSQRSDGAFPSLINGQSGQVESWNGAAGLLWIAALLESASGFPSPLPGAAGEDWVDRAELAGEYYATFVEDEFIFGGPEDVDLAPSSEDGYNALIAYLTLFEATSNPRWLELARRAAEWMLSFRWSYNIGFPPHTLLDQYDYRSRGADLASPRNQHLHTYGLICLAELARLTDHTGDAYYRDRARDSLANALQLIARDDGDFNARKGMVTERYYNSRCFGPKGGILPVSHAWSAGLVVYACGAGLTLDT